MNQIRSFLSLKLLFAAIFLLSGINVQDLVAQKSERPVLKVFWLAGQSNMQGQGVVDLDHPEHYNHGRGTLNNLLLDPDKKPILQHAHDGNGNWKTRDDVFVRFQTSHELKTGGLTIGFTGYEGNHHIGPEFQFGHVVGEAYEQPVLIVKTAWGGKSLRKDFRPPGSGGELGPFYKQMIKEFHDAIANVENEFPQLNGMSIEVAGFVWFQGWNDMVESDAVAEYEQNLIHLINDVRTELGQPDLPVVVGELGNGGVGDTENPIGDNMQRIREAQFSATMHGPFIGNVGFVKTSPFARPKEQSPNVGHGHHWFGNAESYFLIGDALGKKMLDLIQQQELPKVLILGDSISIGYMKTVQESLAAKAVVCRPTNRKGNPENCAGTTNGIANIDRWLRIGGGNWDVILFNFGLHDLKHVDPQTHKNSLNENDPPQADLETYEKQLREIVAKLKATNAKLVFATTTPVPQGGVKPFRDPDSPSKYNEVATKIMDESRIPIADLYSFAHDKLGEIQKPVDVHFTKDGSARLGRQVVGKIEELLPWKIRN